MKKNLFLLLLSSSIIFYAQAQKKIISVHPYEQAEMKLVKVSPKLSQIKSEIISKDEKQEAPENASLKNIMPYINPNAYPHGEDPVLQKNYAQENQPASSAIQILSNWDGLSVGNVEPSDNTLAVGPHHVVQMVNGSGTLIRIWNKQTGALLVNSKSVSSIAGSSNIGDPSIVYDAQADRFIMLVIGGNLFFSSNLTICVSKTNDPTGEYYVYSVGAGGLFFGDFPDYPKISVWGNSYFVTTNSGGPIVWTLDRNKMITGAAAGRVQKFHLKDFPGGGIQSLSPVTVTGNTQPPSNSNAVMMRVFDDAWSSASNVDKLELFTMQIDWANSSNSTITGPFVVNIATYDSRLCTNDLNAGSCIPQKDVSRKLDALGGIIMDKAQYRNFGTYQSIVCTHMSDARGDGVAGVRWYELRKIGTADWTVFQQGTYSPNDGSHRFMGSVTINSNGTIALGYNSSGTTLFPGIRVTGRNINDASGNLTAPETIAKAGSASQTSSNRYGDYNGMVTDPTDGSFWFTGNYNPTPNWATNVVHFKINASAPISENINAQPSESGLKIIPNPANNYIIISFKSNEAANVPVQILNFDGNVMLEKAITAHKGDNNVNINISSVKNGYYVVKCQVNGTSLLQKLFVQK